jgi:putative membrane protein
MMHKYRKYFLYFLILMYVSGALGFVFSPGFFRPFTPVTLLFTSMVFLMYQPLQNSRYLLWFFAVALIGYVSEVIGVATGFVFGNYVYGEALGYKVLGVPLTISLNWALLIGAAVAVSASVLKNRWLLALLASVMVTLIDVLMEQLAPTLDFWRFDGGIAGLHNYAGWLLVSFMAAYMAIPIFKKGHGGVSWIILLLQIYFFGLIYIIN